MCEDGYYQISIKVLEQNVEEAFVDIGKVVDRWLSEVEELPRSRNAFVPNSGKASRRRGALRGQGKEITSRTNLLM